MWRKMNGNFAQKNDQNGWSRRWRKKGTLKGNFKRNNNSRKICEKPARAMAQKWASEGLANSVRAWPIEKKNRHETTKSNWWTAKIFNAFTDQRQKKPFSRRRRKSMVIIIVCIYVRESMWKWSDFVVWVNQNHCKHSRMCGQWFRFIGTCFGKQNQIFKRKNEAKITIVQSIDRILLTVYLFGAFFFIFSLTQVLFYVRLVHFHSIWGTHTFLTHMYISRGRFFQATK